MRGAQARSAYIRAVPIYYRDIITTYMKIETMNTLLLVTVMRGAQARAVQDVTRYARV